jgi:hypothetical protein
MSKDRNTCPRWTSLWQVLPLGLLLALIACGGGGSQGSPPPNPDFSLAVSPTSQSVNSGSSASVSLSATAVDGFSSQISVQVTGVPAGVTVSPISINLVPGTPLQVTFSAAANAGNASATVTFTGTSGSLTHTAGLGLTVNASTQGLPTRTRYLRTDATTEYFSWVNQHWIIYHANTGRYFVTDPSSNQIIVIDAATQTEVGSIGVPGAFGIDQTPDGTTLWVGTLIGDVYSVDPVGMTVIQRYIGSEIGPDGYLAFSALVLADGRLALLGGQGGLLVIGGDGADSFAVWNPTDNSITIYYHLFPVPQGVPLPCGQLMGSIGGFTRTVDRTQVIIGSADSDGTLCEVNEATGQGTYGTASGFLLNNIVTSPDGKYIIQPSNPGGAVLYNAQTLIPVAKFNILGDASSASGFFVSPDSTTLFTPGDPETAIIYAYSLATQQLVGWVPNLFMEPISGGVAFGPIDSPYLLATDGTGLFAGPLEEGIGFVDLSVLQTGPVGTQFQNAYAEALSPPTGPTSGGTATQWSDASSLTLQSIYFGPRQATNISTSPNDPYPFLGILATSPSGSAGPTDVYAFTTDGGMQLLPEAFSYGPTILEVTPNMATAEGGGTGYIYGYGFGPLNSNAIPSGLTVTVGGVAARVTAFAANAYGGPYPPFPLQSVAYTIPPGTSGSAVNVTVTTSAGSTMASSALTYLPATQQFPLTGSTLAQGIYDSYTGLYYFTDTTQIQVFSRTQRKWLSPISIPAPPGATQRLWGIALSPDGSKLAVSDAMAGAIYLLDPANPTSVQTFIVGSQNPPVEPCGLAVSDVGNVYYMVFGPSGGADQFFKLNTNTGAITNYDAGGGPGLPASDMYLRNAISSDNAYVFYDEDGLVFSIDTATDTLFIASDGDDCCYGNYELALSSGQTQLTATFYLYDSELNGESYYALNDREILNILYVYGAKLSPDGRLLFQPSTNGVDVLDGNLGNLRNRISLLVPLSPNYDALVDDGTDNVLIAITGTGNGIAIVDLTEVPESGARSAFRTHRVVGMDNRLREDSDRGIPLHQRTSRSAAQRRTVPHLTRGLFSSRMIGDTPSRSKKQHFQ